LREMAHAPFAGLARPRAHPDGGSVGMQSHREAAGLLAAGRFCTSSCVHLDLTDSYVAVAALQHAVLLQVYATPPAFDQDPAAFHRAVFLFISPQVRNYQH
jgi:hypothetical protein